MIGLLLSFQAVTQATVTLENQARRMVTHVLPHDAVCTEQNCLCSSMLVGVQDHDPTTGNRSVRAIRQRIAKSITFTAQGTEGCRLVDLPEAALRAPSIAAAVAAGDLKQIVAPKLTAKLAVPQVPVAPAQTTQSRGRKSGGYKE